MIIDSCPYEIKLLSTSNIKSSSECLREFQLMYRVQFIIDKS